MALAYYFSYFSTGVIGCVSTLLLAVFIYRVLKYWWQEEHIMGDARKGTGLSETEETSLIQRAKHDETANIDEELALQEKQEDKSKKQSEETSHKAGDRGFDTREGADISGKLEVNRDKELNSQIEGTGHEVGDKGFETRGGTVVSGQLEEKRNEELNSQIEETSLEVGDSGLGNEKAAADTSEELQDKQEVQLKRRIGESSCGARDSRFKNSEQLQDSKKAANKMGLFQSKNSSSKKQRQKRTLEEFGYQFNEDGELRKADSGAPFEFNVIPGDHEYNQGHYEELGKVVDDYVYCLLEAEGLVRVRIPINASDNKPTGFFFMSEGAVDKDRLLVLIHGSGVVRAGQWARRLIINNNLQCGTQLPFIKKAMKDGYGVVVMNTNLNNDEDYQVIKGSSTPEEHGYYVWKNFVKRGQCKHIAIVAHSYGGVVVGSLANEFTKDFLEKVFAVAFTDSFGYQFGTKSPLHNLFKRVSVNWVSSDRPVDEPVTGYGRDFPMRSAGVTKHEWTSWSSFASIFKFFEERYKSVTNPIGDAQQGAQSRAHLRSDQSKKQISDHSDQAQGDQHEHAQSIQHEQARSAQSEQVRSDQHEPAQSSHHEQVQSVQSEEVQSDQTTTQNDAEHAHNDQSEKARNDQKTTQNDAEHEHAHNDQSEKARSAQKTTQIDAEHARNDQSEKARSDQKTTQIDAEHAHNDQSEKAKNDQHEQAKGVQHEPAQSVQSEVIKNGQHRQTGAEHEQTHDDQSQYAKGDWFEFGLSGQQKQTQSGQHEQTPSGQSEHAKGDHIDLAHSGQQKQAQGGHHEQSQNDPLVETQMDWA